MDGLRTTESGEPANMWRTAERIDAVAEHDAKPEPSSRPYEPR